MKAAIQETAICLRQEGDPEPALEREALDRWLTGPRGVGHNLDALATRLDSWLIRLDVEQLPKDFRTTLMSLHEFDPKGDSFRYATVRRKDMYERALRPGLKKPEVVQAHVDVVAVHEHFMKAFNLLRTGSLRSLKTLGIAWRKCVTRLAGMGFLMEPLAPCVTFSLCARIQ